MSGEPRACRKATMLISAAADRPLDRRERVSLRLHLLICGSCRRFRKQIRWVGSFVRESPKLELPVSFLDAHLTPDAKARIGRAVENAIGPR